ncbi:hypothetical protein [Lacinutrix salivirga]
MLVLDSSLRKEFVKSHFLEIGNLFFFKNYVISEVNEGVHFSYSSAKEYILLIAQHYKNHKVLGYISNRVNTFSIEALDYPKLLTAIPNIEVFCTVTYSYFDSMNVDIEKQFCKKPYLSCSSLLEATQIIKDRLVLEPCLSVK